MNEYLDFQNRRFEFVSQKDALKIFRSSDDSVHTCITIESDELRTYKNDCIFIFDSEKEELIRFTLNENKIPDKTTAYKFTLNNSSLKKWGGSSSQYPNLNSFVFSGDEKKEEYTKEYVTYYIQYSPEELKLFVDNIFKNLTAPCFEMTTIIRYFLDGGKSDTDEKIKSGIYKYVLLPNKKYGDFKIPEESDKSKQTIVKTENSIIYEDSINYFPPSNSTNPDSKISISIRNLLTKTLFPV